MSDPLTKQEIGKILGLFLFTFIIVFTVVSLVNLLNDIKDIKESKPLIISLVGKQGLEQEKPIGIEQEDSIVIPKIEVRAPLVFLKDKESDFLSALDRGVAHYPGSSLPDEKGTAIFLGHSAPKGWPKIRHDWVFSSLNELEQGREGTEGDEIYIIYQNYQYSYKVIEKIFLDKGEKIPEYLTNSENYYLILISCWPPGQDLRRIAVVAERK